MRKKARRARKGAAETHVITDISEPRDMGEFYAIDYFAGDRLEACHYYPKECAVGMIVRLKDAILTALLNNAGRSGLH